MPFMSPLSEHIIFRCRLKKDRMFTCPSMSKSQHLLGRSSLFTLNCSNICTSELLDAQELALFGHSLGLKKKRKEIPQQFNLY